jgi:hypothetical protein
MFIPSLPEERASESMGAQEEANGLTLEGLAQRLETLERENERMRSENSELRDEVSALRGSVTRGGEVAVLRGSATTSRTGQAASEFAGRVSRRSLLSKAGAAAVAAVAAGTLLGTRQAKASHFATDLIEADRIRTHFIDAASATGFPAMTAWTSSNTSPALSATNAGSKPAIEVNSVGGQGVLSIATNNAGLEGRGVIGVRGLSVHGGQAAVYGEHINEAGPGVVGDANGPDYAGVLGRNSDGTGVWGRSSKTGYGGVYGEHTGTAGYGMVGDGKGQTGAGVLGRNSGGEGIRGEGSTQAEVAGVRGLGKTGVWGSTGVLGYSGVYGQHTGSAGFGLVGDGTGSTGAGVLGRDPSGPGIEGRSSKYGGKFAGNQAQLMLVPKSTTGKPTSGAHSKGEIYMDSAGALFVCTVGGTPGTWRKVTTTAA